jgi:hypothetical protein
VLCRTDKEARQAYDDLKEMLRPTGMVLKEGKEEAIRRLKDGAKARYMGFEIVLRPDGLHFDLTDDAWDSLEESLQLAQDKPNAPIHALLALAGWLSQRGPSYPSVNIGTAYARVRAAARRQGFDEIPGQKWFQRNWQCAFARWRRLCPRC